MSAVLPLVLVVDDDPMIRELLANCLRLEQLQVLVAQDGATALERVAVTSPELILLDAAMPGMDGIETCRRLKRDVALADIPIILLQETADEQTKGRVFAEGAVDYLTKPFHFAEVIARVHTQIRLRGHRRDAEQARAQTETQIALRTSQLTQANALLSRELADVQQRNQQLEADNRYLQREIGARYRGVGKESAPHAASQIEHDRSAYGFRYDGGTSLDTVARDHIIAVLRRARGVIEGTDGAATLLRMAPSTLRHRMRKLAIGRADYGHRQ